MFDEYETIRLEGAAIMAVRAGLLAAGLVLSPVFAGQALAENDFRPIPLQIDRTVGSASKTSTIELNKGKLEILAKEPFVCIDLGIRLDGKSDYHVLTSTEDADRRFNVDCRPGIYGRLPMGHGVEYYVRSESPAESKIELAIYPGERTTHIYNDVACTFDKTENVSTFHIKGYFAVLTTDFPDVTVAQLRPALPSREEVKACRDGGVK